MKKIISKKTLSKKILSKKPLACLLVLSLALAGLCATAVAITTEEVLGDWYLQIVEMQDVTATAAAMGTDIHMKILPAGGASIQAPDSALSDAPMAWKLEDDALLVWQIDAETEAESFTREGETLVNYDGEVKMIFGRKALQTLPLSPVVVATELSAFNGDWTGLRLYDGASLRAASSMGLEANLSIAGGKVKLRSIQDGMENTYEGKAKLAEGILTATLKDSDGQEMTLQLTLHADDTLSYPLAAPLDSFLVLCERSEAAA